MFIVLEGADGSGKTTQFNLLSERLQAVGYEVAVFDFPRYNEPSSHFIQSYLNGKYGPASQISPYTASLFYALDRYETKSSIISALNAGKIVLSNRFVGSNMAHQGSKFTNIAERRGFFIWEDSLEFELLGIPRPNLNLFLHVPAEISYKLVGKKSARSYTDKKHDEHEGDINHLRQTVETYEQLCKLFPKDFKLIECTRNNKILSIPQINNRIWETIKPILPRPQNKPQSRIIRMDKPTTEPQSTPVQKIITSGSINRNELLKINVKGVSLLETRYILSHLSAGDEISIPKRANLQLLLTPAGMAAKPTKAFRQFQNRILSNYKTIAAKVGTEIAQAVLPLGYLVDVHARGSQLDWLKLMLDLSEHADAETKKMSLSLSKQLDKRWPDLSKKIRAGSTVQNKASAKILNQSRQSDDLKSVSLINVVPHNELGILADVLYGSLDLSRDEIAKNLDAQTYQQKSDTLIAYLANNSVEREVLLEKTAYDFDLVTSGTALAHMLSLSIFKNIQIQPATPRFGYDVPDEIDKVGLTDTYLDSFDSSLSMYSDLQADGYEHDAQYAVLLGNRVRWHGTLTARGFLILRQLTRSSILNELKMIARGIEESILETHPIIGLGLIRSSESSIPTTSQNKRGNPGNKKRKR